MRTSNNKVLSYKINKTLMTEINTLEKKFQAALKKSKTSRYQQIDSLRNLGTGIYKRSELEDLKFDDLKPHEMLRVITRKYYALEHGKNISRGKAYAKAKRLAAQGVN